LTGPQSAGAGIRGVEGKLRGHERDILARLADLARHRLARLYVALEGGALACRIKHVSDGSCGL